MAIQSNPIVNLRHEELDRNTSQPVSVARHLCKSGWEPADDQSAALLDMPLVSKKKASSNKASRSDDSKSTGGTTSKSNAKSDASEGKN